MRRATILLADNHLKFLETRARVLEEAGYKVLVADSPDSARNTLKHERIDAAILDLRLEDDRDDHDISGLLLAKQCSPHIPKIILTHYPSFELAADGLAFEPGGLPPAVRFIEKNPQFKSGTETMLQAVEDAIKIGRTGFSMTMDEVSTRLNDDYELARQDAKTQTWIAGIVSILGVFVIVSGVGVALLRPNIYQVGVIATAGGLITEAVNFLFLQRLEKTHARVDKFHHELYQIKLLQTLKSATEELVFEENREKLNMKILLQAGSVWFNKNE